MRYHLTLVFESHADMEHFTNAMKLTEMASSITKAEETLAKQLDAIEKNKQLLEKIGIKIPTNDKQDVKADESQSTPSLPTIG